MKNMDKEKTIVIVLLFFIGCISFSSASEFFSNEDTEKLDLVRVPYSDEYITLFQDINFDIIAMKPEGWIDVLIVNADLHELEKRNIDYSIQIDDIDGHFNEVRGSYRTFPEMEQALQDIAADYPNITSLYSIGTSYEGRNIWCLEIAENPGVDEGKPGVFFIGLHHAREWPTVEITMYIAENLTSNYGSDPEITDIINNRRIWIVPCQNPDGYVYSHDLGNNMWRKNRQYFPSSNTFGVDLNRNYGGSCNGDAWGAWGSVGSGSITHNPSSDTYCGPWSMSEQDTHAIKNMFIEHDICAAISWHTYSELVLWPWGYSEYETTPDNAYMSQVGIGIASEITKQSGSGTYSPMQSSGLYPTTGDTTDWAYGYSHYVKGKTCFPYTIEACTSFFPSETYLDQICEENYDGAFHLLQEAANIDTIIPRVIPPVIEEISLDNYGDYTVSWTEQNPLANPSYFQLDELTNLSKITDDAENGLSLWDSDGFSPSTSRAYSGTHSFKSRYANNDVSSMVSTYPLPVEGGMDLSFWCWYYIETNYDMGFVEISTDGRSYELLDVFNGNSNGWTYKEYSLEPWIGESIHVRFRHTTDSYTLKEGFYVDDIYPVASFDSVITLSDEIPTTSFDVIGNDEGIYYYQVKGYNDVHGWGDFSNLKSINVTYDDISLKIQNMSAFPRVQEIPGWVNISCSVLSSNDISNVNINVTKPDETYLNQTMEYSEGLDVFYFNTSYSQNGTYEYYVWVNTSEEQKSSFDFHFHIGSGFIDIVLEPGWNLITLPVETGWDASDLAENIPGCDSVNRWDQFEQSYDGYLVDGPASWDFPLEAGYGYFVETTMSSMLSVTGESVINVDVPLEVSWNLIGWYDEEGTTAMGLAENISGCVSVNRWNASVQSYDGYLVGGPASWDFDIMQGMGLFVEVNESSNWN